MIFLGFKKEEKLHVFKKQINQKELFWEKINDFYEETLIFPTIYGFK